MRTFSKLALAASIAVAATFTMVSCSADDIADIFDDPSSSSVADGSGDETSSSSKVVEANPVLDRAFRFMTYHIGLEENDGYSYIIDRWHYGRDDYYYYDWSYGDYREARGFENEDDFGACRSDYYETLDENRLNSEGLKAIADYYANGMGATKILSSSMFKSSGAKDLMRILIMAHDDIYKGGKSGADIYDLLTEEKCGIDYDYWGDPYEYCGTPDFPYGHFDVLSEENYISEKTLNEIKKINGNDEDDYMSYSDYHFAAWAYSFWGRRASENMDGAVYSLLKTVENMYK